MTDRVNWSRFTWLREPLTIAAITLAFGWGQLLIFPQVEEVGVEVLTEGALIPLLLGSLIFVASLGLERRLETTLYAGIFLLLIFGTTETADELVRSPLAFIIVAEHLAVIVGFGLIVEGIRQWGKTRHQRVETLKRNRDFLRYTERLTSVGGWEIDFHTDELRWTPGMRRIHNAPDDYDPPTEEAFDFYPPENRELIEQAIERCRQTGDPFDLELRANIPGESKPWMNVRGRCQQRNGGPRLRGIVQDISSRKQREQQMQVLNRVLRHNLRNDMNVIWGRASNLVADLSDPNAVAEARKIEDTAAGLLALSEKANHFQTLSQRTEPPSPVDVVSVVKDIRETLQETYPGADVTTHLPKSAMVLGTTQLDTALRELGENAIKHTDEGAPSVTIRVTPSDEPAGWITVDIIDTGPGIPEEEQAVLREGKETPLTHGSGLGLWLVNWIVTSIGGEVEIADNDPRGSVVTVVLPTTNDIQPSTSGS